MPKPLSSPLCRTDRHRNYSAAVVPGNALIHHLAGTAEVSAVLPVVPAVILIGLSVLLTLLGGLIPSKKAAKSDPVTALRTE